MNALADTLQWLRRMFRPDRHWSVEIGRRRQVVRSGTGLGEWTDASGENPILVLPCHEVVRLTDQSNVRRVVIEEGLVWLTTTPAQGDIILRTGDEFALDQSWPVVIEAFAETRLRLEQAGPSLAGMIVAGKKMPLRL